MIKKLTISHASAIYAYLCDVNESPDIFFNRPTSVEDTMQWITLLLLEGIPSWVVEDGNKVLGVVTLKKTDTSTLQIGFYFRVSARGTGVFRYVKEICQLAHKIKGVSRIIATPYPTNIRCQKFLLKLNFFFQEAFSTHHVYAYSL